MTPTCKSCGAPLVWAESITGTPIPLNAEPSPRGTMRLIHDPDTHTPIAVHVPDPQRPIWAGQLYLAHFATCPAASEHRRPPPQPAQLRYEGD